MRQTGVSVPPNESMNTNLQHLCELGQSQLMAMRYLDAESALVQAEAIALANEDWDTLSRLYMPLQECRRQRRQRCGEGVVKLDLFAASPDQPIVAEEIVARYPHGQLLVAGWASIDPPADVRTAASHRQLYLETYLGAIYPLPGDARCVVIVPTADIALPAPMPNQPVDELLKRLPPFSIVLHPNELPAGEKRGDTTTYAFTMATWERLHLPFLAAGDQTKDPRHRIAAYRRTIEVDYACELAHQRLSETAKELMRTRR
jgi:hypothetical protein